jgi:hypothetical protein
LRHRLLRPAKVSGLDGPCKFPNPQGFGSPCMETRPVDQRSGHKNGPGHWAASLWWPIRGEPKGNRLPKIARQADKYTISLITDMSGLVKTLRLLDFWLRAKASKFIKPSIFFGHFWHRNCVASRHFLNHSLTGPISFGFLVRTAYRYSRQSLMSLMMDA